MLKLLRRYLVENLFTPPYPLLPLAVFAYFVVCFLLHPLSPLRTGVFSDPDDYMRLNETIAWFKGQGWHDMSMPRLSPGAGTVIHWARLVDLPIAFFMLPFIKLLGLTGAALAASFIVPFAQFGLLLALAPAIAKPFVGEKRANIATLMLLFAPMMLFNFTPGRVDHHGWQVLIAGFALLGLARIVNDRNGWRWAIGVAAAFVCGLWIGTEALPWAILFAACLAALAAWQGGIALRNAAVFGIAFPVTAAIVLPLAIPPQEYTSLALSWFSLADVLFAALTGAVFVIGWAGGRNLTNRNSRLALLAALGLVAAVVFCLWVPGVEGGPFADYDEFNSTIALANIGEGQPLIHSLWLDIHNRALYAPFFVNAMKGLFLPLAACFAIVLGFRAAAPRQRPLWLAHGVFLFVALLLALFWQVRVGWFMQFFTIMPLTWFLCAWWDYIGDTLRGRARLWAEIAVFIVLGPLACVLVPGFFFDSAFASNIVLFPAARAEKSCSLKQAADFLSWPWGYGKQTHTILSGLNEGPELLFRTPHNAIAAPFNVDGNRAMFDFFNAHDDKAARAVLQKWNVDLVLVCRAFSPFYAGMDRTHIMLAPGAKGQLRLTANPGHPSLIERLIYGETPWWLKPVEIPGNTDYLLFEVRRR